jgi:uncharacterized membrane protein YhiD involved in acid resistance
MQTLSTLEFVTRLAVGVGCGALIGVERQWRARMAGLRTNALVAAGATWGEMRPCMGARQRARAEALAESVAACVYAVGASCTV